MFALPILQVAGVFAPTAGEAAMPLLWRDLQIGMSPEQTAEKIRTIDGVKDVKVNRNRKNKFKSIEFKYKDQGIHIGPDQMLLTTLFDGESLTEISLSSSACASAALEKMKLLKNSLTEKYGNVAPEKVVDENGVEIEKRAAFWTDEIRVRMSWQINVPSQTYTSTYGNGKLGNALAALSNSMSQSAYEAAVNACPDDRGSTVLTTINYSSQSKFLVEHEAEVKARDAKAKATRDAL